MTTQPDLLPCPFCGGTPGSPYRDNGDWYVECGKCGCERRGDTQADVIAAWNRRPTTTQPETPVAWIGGPTMEVLQEADSEGDLGTVLFKRQQNARQEPLFTADAIASAYRRGREDAAQVAEAHTRDVRSSGASMMLAAKIAAAIRARNDHAST